VTMTDAPSDDRAESPYQGRPDHGLRLVLVRRGDRAPYPYEGHVYISAASVPVRVEVSASATAVHADAPGLEADVVARLEHTVSALVRAATRAEIGAGATPPRKIVRWRGFP
jgi:hypothetical protein